MFPHTRLFLSLFKRTGFQKADYCLKLSEKPLGSLFFHPKVQFYMEKLVTVDYDSLFRVKRMGKVDAPVYKLMTDEELQAEKEKFVTEGGRLLQPPPVIDITEDKVDVLSNDPCIDGYEKHYSKLVFIDISFDLKPHERFVVVREPNGLLRTANKDEKSRANQIYYPVDGKEIFMPKMFEPEYLKDIIDRGDYEFILNRACIQFEPDEKDFHRVVATTYEALNENNAFEKICKTRHFGSFAFYLAVNRKINNLLQYFMKKEKLTEASYLVNLLNLVNSERQDSAPEEAKVEDPSFDDSCKTIVDYISNPSNDASALEFLYNEMVQKLKEEHTSKNVVLEAHFS